MPKGEGMPGLAGSLSRRPLGGSVLAKLPLRSKLILVVSIPLFVILGFAGFGISNRLSDLDGQRQYGRLRVPNDALAGSFFEAEHLGGDTDMVALIAAIVAEERKRKAAGRADWQIPMRPDHGQDILDDLGRRSQPGYPTIGRLKGLAELRGIMTALEHAEFGLR